MSSGVDKEYGFLVEPVIMVGPQAYARIRQANRGFGTPRCEDERGSGCRQTIALQIGQGERKGTGRGEARMRWLHNSIPRKLEVTLPS